MATADYNIANQPGVSFRSDLNDTLAAIVSNNSSATEPASTFAYMWWVDTNSNILKQRNAGNTAWVSKLKLANSYVNVDNTSDVDKPVSTAGQTALDDLESETTTAIRSLYPVGSIYMNATNATNPSTLLGFGTWAAFGAGRVPVGHDASDALFDVAEETGGSKDAVNVSHSHTGSADSAGGHSHSGSTNTAGSHSHTIQHATGSGGPRGVYNDEGDGGTANSINAAGNHSHSLSINAVGNHAHTVSVDTSGVSGTNANLQPYITVYMWKRTL